MPKKGKSSAKKGKAEACEPETELQPEQQPEKGSTERAGSVEPELTVEAEPEHQAVCPICEQVIVDPSDEEDGEDSVFCDGECQCWLHRCCACLPKTAFEKLNKQVPFYCPMCSSRIQTKAIDELRDTVAALSAQVQDLQTALSARDDPSKGSGNWATVVKRGQRGRQRGHSSGSRNGNGGRKGESAPNHSSSSHNAKGTMSNVSGDEARDGASQQSSPTRSHQQQVREKEVVKGKRRIWGTLKAASATALMRNICQLTGISEEKVQIKRKYKNLGGNKIQWWHIVSGNENDLESLDDKWEGVRIQTGWKLERCYVEANFLNKERQPPT